MSANIYRHEFRARVKSVVIWSLAVAAVVFVFCSFFAVFADQAALMNEMLAKFPPELRAAFGMDGMDLSSVLGFYSFIFLFVQLCLAIQAANYGFGLVSIEETELTADFLLSKPVSRMQVLTSKLLAALTSLTITNLVVWVSSFAAITLFRDGREYEPLTLLLLLLSIVIFQLFFLSVGLIISLLVKRVRSVTPYALGLGFGSYVLSAFSGVFGEVKLELITPFKHLDAASIVQRGGYNTPLVLLNVGITGRKLSVVPPPRHSGGIVRRCMMNIFVRELKANLKSLLIWSIIIALLIMIAVAKFSAFAGDPQMLKMLDSMPPALLDALSMRAFNLTTLSGFYGIMLVYFGLMGAIAAAMWGSEIISKEERDKTVEFSLVLPVSRTRVITAKALAALVNCLAFVLITWGVSIVAVRSYSPDRAFYNFLALEMQAMLAIELIFLAIGLLLGCAMKQYRLSGSTAVGIILVTYFMSIISGMQARLDFLKYFTPFKYFDAGELFSKGKMDSLYLLLSAGIIIVSVATAYWAYNKRDLYI